jgi:hypothetical protein
MHPIDHPSSNGLLYNDVAMADETQRQVYNPDRNENLKGRKRFNADLTDIQVASNAGLVFSGLTVKSESHPSYLKQHQSFSHRNTSW